MSLLDAFLEDGLEESMVNENGPKEVWFAIRSDGQKGQGTANDPYNGLERNQFDELMDGVPENTTIRLGPGVFKTRGGHGNGVVNPAWLPKSGQRIVGSGMFVTTLKLVVDSGDTKVGLPPDASRMFYAIGGSLTNMSSYEVSHLTVDCNMAGQPPTLVGGNSIGYARVNCAAIRLFGTNLKVRRVRVVNWGRKNSFMECFPVWIGKNQTPPQYPPEEMSDVIEDCIIEQPDWNTGDQATLISAQVIRNCFVRGDRVRPDGAAKPTLKPQRARAGQCARRWPRSPGGLGAADGRRIHLVRDWGIDTVSARSADSLVRAVLACSLATRGQGCPRSGDRDRLLLGTPSSAGRTAGSVRASSPRLLPVEARRRPALGLQAVRGAVPGPPDSAVRHDTSCLKVKVFNNQKSSAEFLPVLNSTSGLHDWELTNEAEDAFLVR